ncbi:MAG: hypothetical protein ACREOZ_03285 [Gloeomargaritales cyanobacterium]
MNITTTHTNTSSTNLTEAQTQQRTVNPVIASTVRDDERDLTPAMQKALRQQDNCQRLSPFTIMSYYREAPVKLDQEIKDDSTEGDYITFDVRLGAGVNATKYRIKIKIYIHGSKEEWLKWREEFATLINIIPLNSANLQHNTIQSLLRGDALSRYNLAINALGHPPDLDEISTRLNEMTSEIMSTDSVRLTTEYLRRLRKPRTLTIQAFQARIMTINAYIPYMPDGEENQKLKENEIKQIIENGVPIEWRRQQRSAHRINFNLQETISYYTELQALENESNRNNNTRGSAQPTSSNNNGARNRNNTNNRYINRNNLSGRGRSSSSGHGQQGNRPYYRQQNNSNNTPPARGPNSNVPWCRFNNTNNPDISEC